MNSLHGGIKQPSASIVTDPTATLRASTRTTKINCIYQNVRGIKSKLRMWRINLHIIDQDLIAATETFLDTSVEDTELVNSEWNVLRRDRGTPCGGVLLMARSPIVLRRRREFETDCGEDLWSSFKWHGHPIYVCVVYVKPSATDSDYMTWFTKVESFVNDLKGTVIILGDLNLNSASLSVLNYYCYFLTFCNMCERNAVENMYGGMLDVVLVQESASLHDVSVRAVEGLVPLDAYHPPLDIQVKLQLSEESERLEPSNVDRSRDWNFKKCNRDLLYGLLAEVSWDAVTSSNDVRTSTQVFYDIIYRLFDACIPKKRRNIKSTRRYPTWFTSDIILGIQKKIKLHSAWKKSKCELIYKQFSDYRSSLKSRITTAYDTYIRRIEWNIKKNPKEFWQHISNLKSKGGFEPNVTHKGKMHSGVAAAEAFAEYFASVFQTEVPKLDLESIANPGNCNISNYINILSFADSDISTGINKIKLDSAIGPDNIPPWFLKEGKEFFIRPLNHIFNLAL